NKTISIKGKLLAFLLTIAGSLAIDKLISYTPYIVYLTRDRETHISSFTYIFAGISILFIIFWNKLNSFKSKLIMENMNLFCFLSLLVVLLQSNGVLIQMTLRMNSYFFFVYIILVPAVISSIKNVHMRIGMYFSLHLVLLLYLVRTICFNGHLYDLVPYSMNFNLFK
ncbi:EpsG family protein, partial [Bacteroides fragilis]